MGFLDTLIKDPKYQQKGPRPPEEINEPDIIISPDTRRENRIPPGQSRTEEVAGAGRARHAAGRPGHLEVRS